LSGVVLGISQNDRGSNELPRVVHWPTSSRARYRTRHRAGGHDLRLFWPV